MARNIGRCLLISVLTVVAGPGLAWAEGGSPPTYFFGFFDATRMGIYTVEFGFLVLLLWLIAHARAGKALYMRRIAGLDAVEEAIGRATEMGKPLLFVNGLNDPSSISTVAAINMLGLIARKVAEYETPLKVPNVDPVTFAVEKETVKEAYLQAGKGDAYDPDCVFYIAGTQFAYTAGVCGLMVRDQPATILYLGYFYAEALMLAETGATTEAIQIAGTDSVTQLPFFVASCDYTLIGEELYAASAYLTKEPLLLGALKAQDYAKFFVAATLVVGVLFTLLSKSDAFANLLHCSLQVCP